MTASYIIGGRMHSDAQFAGSSSVNKFSSFALGKTNKFLLRSLVRRFPHTPKMMGFLGIGNNPMVGATVAIAVDVSAALSK